MYRTHHIFKPRVHYDRDAEAAVLGACIIEEGAAEKLIAMPEHFHYSGCQFVCSLIHEMVSKKIKIDLITIVSYCYNEKNVQHINNVNADFFITNLTNFVVSSRHISEHQHMIIHMARKRQAIFDRFEKPKPKTYGLSMKLLRLLLAKATPKKIRASIGFYGKKTIGESSNVAKVPNEYCVFLMHLYKPDLTWTCELNAEKSLSIEEVKEIFNLIPRIK